MNEWSLRAARRDDAEWLAELRATVLHEDLTRLGRFDPVQVRRRFLDTFDAALTTVIEVEDQPVGCYVLSPREGVVWLESFHLSPPRQGRGLGTAVLTEALAGLGTVPVRLNVLSGSPARRLYERLGFVVDSEDAVDVWMTRRPPSDIENSPDGVLVADGAGVVRRINTAAAQLLGLGSRPALGQPLGEVLQLVDRSGASWLDLNAPYSGLRIRSGITEQSWTSLSGDEVLTRASLIRRSRAGEVDRVVITLRDGRGRERLDRERSDLVATVAHELRSPLTGVKGFVQALLARWDKLEDAQRKLMLETVHADAERLARLITELLDVARLDTGRLSVHPRPVDVVELSRRVVESIAHSTSRTVRLEVAPGVQEINADSDKFTQVLTNLVENAVRHGDGEVCVHLRAVEGGADAPRPAHDVHPGPPGASAEDDHEGLVEVVVTDQGRGIPEEIRRRVVTKFWTEGSAGGTGLGMYLVNGLVRAQGGTLHIDDAPGGGARITTRWALPDY